MKLKYLFSIILSSALMAVGCEQEPADSFKNIKLSDTFLSISPDGGSVELTVTATENWKFVNDEFWPNVVAFNKIGDKTAKPKHDMFGNLINNDSEINKEKTVASWLKASVMEGKTGETKVVFSADGSAGGREIEISLYAGNNIQYLRVRQGSLEVKPATCAEAADAPDGKLLRLKGVVTSIEHFEYGNWWLQDESGKMYIYGTLDANGKTKNFKSLGLEVGDEVEIEGPKGSYKGDPQLVNVSVLDIKKALLKITSEAKPVPYTGGELIIKAAYKGNGVFPTIAEECREWISYVGMDYKKGEPSKLVPDPSDTAIVKFNVAQNNGNPRDGSISLASHSGENKSEVTYTFTQELNSIFTESFNDGQGEFTFDDKLLPEGSAFVWQHGVYNNSGYMKASAYVNKANRASESYLVSPEIAIPAESAKLTFDHALNSLKGGNKNEHIFFCIKDASASEWTPVAIPNMDDIKGDSYDYFSSGDIDLSAYKGKTIRFAFRYVSTAECAPTWQVRNVLLK